MCLETRLFPNWILTLIRPNPVEPVASNEISNHESDTLSICICLYALRIKNAQVSPSPQSNASQSLHLLSPLSSLFHRPLTSIISRTLSLLAPQLHHEKHKRIRANAKQRRNPSLPTELRQRLHLSSQSQGEERNSHLSKHNTSPSN